MRNIYLVCNAHIDPAWVWDWEEGLAEALSTFRIAAQFCEKDNGFVFNQNESLLYEWTKKADPALFARIQKLVANGKWHILGGWYLQPDCNMPSGESFVRQILRGKFFFRKEFKVDVTTAANLDSFGHTRGLVQILVKTCYVHYLFCRPFQNALPLQSDDFMWVGFDGSTIVSHRSSEFYQSFMGQALSKVESWMQKRADAPHQMILWGMGDHGGGASAVDLADLNRLIKESKENIRHSSPEDYFTAIRSVETELPRVEKSLNPFAVGCYSSQALVKQRHCELENMLYGLEKLLCHAALLGKIEYPLQKVKEIERHLLFSEFHDMLPGSGIQKVESSTLAMLAAGLHEARELRLQAFILMADDLPTVPDGFIPIIFYNPHPFPVVDTFECEFNLPSQNFAQEIVIPKLMHNGEEIPIQLEKEESYLNTDWRKKIVFRTELAAFSTTYFLCDIRVRQLVDRHTSVHDPEMIRCGSESLSLTINRSTGLIDELRYKGDSFLSPGAMVPTVFVDNSDPWGMTVDEFQKVDGVFSLMTKSQVNDFAMTGTDSLEPVHILEDGPIRTVVEAFFTYQSSRICLTYYIPKAGSEWSIAVRVYWAEKSKMLKLVIPTSLRVPSLLAEEPFGAEEYLNDGKEHAYQRWACVFSPEERLCFSAINDGLYGISLIGRDLHLTLLRSPAYSSHPKNNETIITPRDRYQPPMDQGEHQFRLWFNQGDCTERIEQLPREAQLHNERPFNLPYYPRGGDGKVASLFVITNDTIELVALKQAERLDSFVIRLRECIGKTAITSIRSEILGINENLEFGPFEVKTFLIQRETHCLKETNMMEDEL